MLLRVLGECSANCSVNARKVLGKYLMIRVRDHLCPVQTVMPRIPNCQIAKLPRFVQGVSCEGVTAVVTNSQQWFWWEGWWHVNRLRDVIVFWLQAVSDESSGG